MKITIFGASGRIGQRISDEALRRGHVVTAAVRDTTKIPPKKNLSSVKADVTVVDQVSSTVSGQDAVINATNSAGNAAGDDMFLKAARSLMDGLKLAGVKRLIVVGGAGSLEIAPGRQLVDSPEFPKDWKSAALAHREALRLYQQNSTLDWTYVSPAAIIEPGKRTGTFRIGTDQLLTDDNGDSRISMEDFAMAILDELEKPKFLRRRFTVSY